jgi:hypothetical protein
MSLTVRHKLGLGAVVAVCWKGVSASRAQCCVWLGEYEACDDGGVVGFGVEDVGGEGD